MQRFNAVTSAVFDRLLAPLGEDHAWFDLLLWSVLGGIVALLVYKSVSDQAGIVRAKNAIKVHLLEIRLFKDDIAGVLAATGRILARNAVYLGHNVVPLLLGEKRTTRRRPNLLDIGDTGAPELLNDQRHR